MSAKYSTKIRSGLLHIGLPFLMLLGLESCRMYGYQPGIVRVPTIDSSTRGEIGGSFGPTVLTHGSVYANYAPGRRWFVGAQTAFYYRDDDKNSDDYFFGSQKYRNYHRGGVAPGINIGTFFELESGTIYLQAGSDLEYVTRSYTQIDSYYDSQGTYLEDSPVAHYSAKATYLKPWVQFSARFPDRSTNDWQAAFILGLRVNAYSRLSSSVSAYGVNGASFYPEDHPKLSESYFLPQGILGADVRISPLIVSLRVQARLNPNFDAWWYSPLLYGNVGLTYPFGRGR